MAVVSVRELHHRSTPHHTDYRRTDVNNFVYYHISPFFFPLPPCRFSLGQYRSDVPLPCPGPVLTFPSRRRLRSRTRLQRGSSWAILPFPVFPHSHLRFPVPCSARVPVMKYGPRTKMLTSIPYGILDTPFGFIALLSQAIPYTAPTSHFPGLFL